MPGTILGPMVQNLSHKILNKWSLNASGRHRQLTNKNTESDANIYDEKF